MEQRNLIIQYYLGGDQNPLWVDFATKSIRAYAAEMNIEYQFHREIDFDCPSPYFSHLWFLYDDHYETKYDNILYLDCDITAKGVQENIFDIEIGDIGAVPDRFLKNIPHDFIRTLEKKNQSYEDGWFNYEIDCHNVLREKFGDFSWKKSPTTGLDQYINSGVLLWSKKGRIKARKLFTNLAEYGRIETIEWGPTPQHAFIGLDQLYVNWQLTINDFDITELPVQWNQQQWETAGKGQFIHHTGARGKHNLNRKY